MGGKKTLLYSASGSIDISTLNIDVSSYSKIRVELLYLSNYICDILEVPMDEIDTTISEDTTNRVAIITCSAQINGANMGSAFISQSKKIYRVVCSENAKIRVYGIN